MVIQYPHTLIATIVTDSYQNNDGNWVPGGTVTRTVKCRVEEKSTSFGIGAILTTTDGRVLTYSVVVYMPKGTEPIPTGTSVYIDCAPAVSGSVISFSKGQLNSRLWL